MRREKEEKDRRSDEARETRRRGGGWSEYRGEEREDISDTRIEEKGRADEIIGLSRAQQRVPGIVRGAARQPGRLNGNG